MYVQFCENCAIQLWKLILLQVHHFNVFERYFCRKMESTMLFASCTQYSSINNAILQITHSYFVYHQKYVHLPRINTAHTLYMYTSSNRYAWMIITWNRKRNSVQTNDEQHQSSIIWQISLHYMHAVFRSIFHVLCSMLQNLIHFQITIIFQYFGSFFNCLRKTSLQSYCILHTWCTYLFSANNIISIYHIKFRRIRTD